MSQPKKKFDLKVILKPIHSVWRKVVSNRKVSLAVAFVVFLMVLAGSIIIPLKMQRKSTETKGKSVETTVCVS